MNTRMFVLAMGCCFLAFACVAQPDELRSTATQNATAQDTQELSDNAVSEASEAAASDLTDRCDDNVCFRSCTGTGACDGFCIANVCTCVGISGPPCS